MPTREARPDEILAMGQGPVAGDYETNDPVAVVPSATAIENKVNQTDVADVPYISTDDAKDTVNQGMDYLDKVAPYTSEQYDKDLAAEKVDDSDPPEPPADPADEGGMTFEEAYELADGDANKLVKKGSNFYLKDEAYEEIGVEIDEKETELTEDVDEVQDQLDTFRQDFLSYNVDEDPAFQRQVGAINEKYDRLYRDMQRANKSRDRALKTLGYRMGTQQYAGAIQMGIEGEELSQAGQRLSDIRSAEAAAIAGARLAYEQGEYTKFSQKIDALKDMRDDKQTALDEYNNKLVAMDEKMREDAEFELKILNYQLDVRKQDFAEKPEEKGLLKPIIVSAGSSIFDPNTGAFIGTAPKPVDTSAPEVEIWGGMVHQWNPVSQSWTTLGSDSDFGGDENSQTVIDWANQVSNGNRKFSDVPDELQSMVNSVIAKMPPPTKSIDEAQKMIDAIKLLYDPDTGKQHSGLDKSVGPKFSGFLTRSWIGTGDRTAFTGQANKLVSQLALEKLIESKSQGATFGALSDREMDILKAASTTLGSWEVRDDSGRVTGYAVSEKAFKEEIKRLISDYQELIDEAKGLTGDTPLQKLIEYGNTHPDERNYIQQLNNPNTINESTGQPYTDEEKLQILGITFNADQNKSVKGSGMRTDRHNNPTALMWTTGVEKFFKDKGYKVAKGDKFPKENLYTLDMSNVSDPVNATIDYIDTYGFYYNGQQRWTHTGMSKTEWDNMSNSQKKNVVKKMYSAEGNKGLLNNYFV